MLIKKRSQGMIWLLGLGMLACTGLEPFTLQEQQRIGEFAEGKMPVYSIENPADSLFLRKQAKALQRKDLESAYFGVLQQRMLLTVKDTANPGVGIAAPQVGISRQLIAVQRFDKPEEPFEFYVNPQITFYSSRLVLGPEGCLSVPDRRDSVWRSEEIVVRYVDRSVPAKSGGILPWKEETIKGFTAVIFQHEIDHLNGLLFIDRSGTIK